MPSAAPALAASRLARPLAALAVFALGLRLAMGPQTFALYGMALIVLAALLPLGRIALEGARRRWPLWLLIGLTAILALGQIGFWLVFFRGGAAGLQLGIGRSMAAPYLDSLGRSLASALILVWLIVLVLATRRLVNTNALFGTTVEAPDIPRTRPKKYQE